MGPNDARDPIAIFVPWGLAAFTLVLIFLCHLPLLDAAYVQDDHPLVEGNAIVERGDWLEIVGSSYWAGAQGDARTLYRPLPILTYAVERRLWGSASPALSHLVNLLLHAAVTLSFVALLRRLGSSPPTTTAATVLFAVLPAHLEAVANVVGRAELLAALMTLLALLCFSRTGGWSTAAAATRARRRAFSWAAGLLLLLALASKEVALAALPLMLVLSRVYRPAQPRRWIDHVGAWTPSALALLFYLGLRVAALESWIALQRPPATDNPLVLLHGGARLATALSLLPRYVGLLLFPGRLSADYSGTVIPEQPGLLAPGPLLGLALLVFLALLALAPFLRRDSAAGRHSAQLLASGAFIFLLPYAVMGNLILPIGTIFAERLIYLPSAGFCLLLGWLIGAIARGLPFPEGLPARRWKTAFFVVLTLIAAAHAIHSHARAREWRDDRTLFAATLRAYPNSPRALFIVAGDLAEQGQYVQAIQHYDRLLSLHPDHPAAAHEKGIALARLGRFAEAAETLGEAVRLRPTSARAHVNLALAQRQAGGVREARRSLRMALVYDDTDPRAWAELGNLELEQREYRRAVEAYRRAIALGRHDLAPRLQMAREALAAQP